MKFGPILPKAYHDPEIYDQEFERIWKPSWISVGIADHLQNHNDFQTTEIAGTPIVLQNFQGQIRAFRNICSHRFAQIQTERQGNRPLMCPYHNWTYNKEGIPIGIPDNDRQFQFSKCDKEKLKLEEYAVEVLDRNVFIRMSKTGPSLKEYLGDWYDHVKHISETYTDRIEIDAQVCQANWKIGVEGTLESYHVAGIHPDSFAHVFDDINLNIETHLEHSRYYGPMSKKSMAYWNKTAKMLSLHRSDRFPDYTTFLIFPNHVLTMSYGTNLTWHTLEPLGPDQFLFRTELFFTESQGKHSAAAREAAKQSIAKFSKTVRDEDIGICNNVHASMKRIRKDAAERGQIIGQIEDRILHFQNAYMNRMKDVL